MHAWMENRNNTLISKDTIDIELGFKIFYLTCSEATFCKLEKRVKRKLYEAVSFMQNILLYFSNFV